MTKRIFRSIVLVALAVFLASLVLILGVLYTYFSQVQQSQLKTQTLLAAQAASHEGVAYFSGLENLDCRITWIAADGSVLYDNRSDSTGMENHLEREEIREALESGLGESVRYSNTRLERSLYCAQRLPDGTVIRLSEAQSSVLNLILGIAQPICVVIAVALVLSSLLAFRLSRRIVEPLNHLDLDDPTDHGVYEELSPLLRRIDSQQRQLRIQTTELLSRKNEFDAVTDGISEGLILLNSRCGILAINRAACRILNVDKSCVGQDILSTDRTQGIEAVLLKALDGIRAEMTASLGASEYLVDASPVVTDGTVTGVALLLFDITEQRRTEQLRREFTANVSHELKTPLQSISGCAELLSHGLVKQEDVAGFSKKIYAESQRMISLVEDILRLSQLDEGSSEIVWQELELQAVAREAVLPLSAQADRNHVTLEVTGDPVLIHSVRQLIVTVAANLCSNAVKYNRRGGSVTLRTWKEGREACLSVADTGIGIPEEDHDRIFERFYRVDKSRSKEVGGTGLGLSIVKHAVQTLRGRIELESTPDVGTTITVRLPLEQESKR